MTRGKREFEIKLTVVRRGQEIIEWVPYIFVALIVGFMLNVACRHKSSSVDTIHSLTVGCHTTKDPKCRLHSAPSSSANYTLDYEEEVDTVVPIPETWKDPGLLILSDFRWILNNESICQKKPDALADTKILPVLVRTERGQFTQRDVIRRSWGSLPIYKGWDIRLIFLTGEGEGKPAPSVAEDDEENDSGDYNQNPDEWTTQTLEQEQDRNGDLVIGSFPDNYDHSTLKDMMGFKWVLNFCPDAEFVMRVEADKFVDIIQWIDWRSEDLERINDNKVVEEEDINDDPIPDLYCHIVSGNAPVRNEGHKWHAPKDVWPEDFYYDYCHNGAYGITVDLIKKLYSVSSERKFFHIEDVFFGALLELVKKKYDWNPIINDCYSMEQLKIDNYREICEENGTTHFEKKKEFGPVTDVDGGKYEQDVMCLWKKTLQDIGVNV